MTAALVLPRRGVPLPRPGPLLGAYPQAGDAAAPWRVPRLVAQLIHRAPRRRSRSAVAAVRETQARWSQLEGPAWGAALRDLRARLGREGLDGAARADALACVAAACVRMLARDPYDTQLVCADALLDGHLAEMATGEGKSLAVALAATAAALAGVPVHVMTANDYLAARDAQALAPLFGHLGLSVGTVAAGTTPTARRAAYACDVTYCTAREVAFDHLRDRLQPASTDGPLQLHGAALAGDEPAPRLLRGLCMALVDEADSLLIDEATMPLVLSQPRPDAAQRAACFQALALARRLQIGRDATLDAVTHAVSWRDGGLARLRTLAAALGGVWLNQSHCRDTVGTALVALHALKRDRDYLVREGRVELLDAVTGRTAAGRVWSRGLHNLVELKEGCALTPATETLAQTSYQRFFARYLRLGGTSGTLAECRGELAAVFGKRVVTIPLHRPCRRRMLKARAFVDDVARHCAIVERVRELAAQGRPVLVGVATVGQARELSARLDAAGLVHRVLDARFDADEAAIVAQAGQRGAVTVATAMAGRGTDIELGAGVVELGGLHVINAQDNASARLDRQLVGRAARQGDPGSAETWWVPTHRAHPAGGALPGKVDERPRAGAGTESGWPLAGRKNDREGELAVPGALLRAWVGARQRAAGRKAARLRRLLLEQDLAWQTRLNFKHLRA